MSQFDGGASGKTDFILMDEVSEAAFMENLKVRFENNRIYTYIGETVVSVNPYRELDIYNDQTVEDYRNKELFERPPHVFALADAAFQDMKWRQKDACIVISGLCVCVCVCVYVCVCALNRRVSHTPLCHMTM